MKKKHEIRNSAPEANPKSEGGNSLRSGEDSAFWSWGDESSSEEPLLHEEYQAPGEPLPDLEERAARFGEAIVRFAKKVPQDPVTNRLISQLVGAGTSVGANYCEAQDAVSRKDFKNRIGTCRKESKESMFFLRMTAAAVETLAPEARELWREARALNRIFGSIWRK